MAKRHVPDVPLLDPDTAIQLLRRQLSQDIEAFLPDDPQWHRWRNTTESIIQRAFGESHPNLGEFTSAYSSARNAHERQLEHIADIRRRKALLEGFIEQLDLMRPNKPAGPLVEREGIYFAGQQFDAMLLISRIVSSATKAITIIDGYIGEDVFSLLSAKTASVIASILTTPIPPALRALAKAFNAQHGGLSIRSSNAFHDRFVIIDDSDFFHFGASIKDLGKRGFMFSRIEEQEMIDALRKKFQQEWSAAKVEL